ncbi:hypothetical protein ACVWW6_001336 [Bradyrhizobium sp. USDA 3311]
MIIGYGANRLERRITTTINNSALTPKELSLLEAILHRIERYRDQAFISVAQARWLCAILTRDEQGTSRSNLRPPKPSRSPHPRTSIVSSHRASTVAGSPADVSNQKDGRPVGFDITDALDPH